MVDIKTARFVSEEYAKAYSEGGMNRDGEGRGYYHVFVFKQANAFGVYWHTEDKYIGSFIPFDSKVCWHGEKMRDETKPNEWAYIIQWDERKGNLNANDLNIFKEVYGDYGGEQFWKIVGNGQPLPEDD